MAEAKTNPAAEFKPTTRTSAVKHVANAIRDGIERPVVMKKTKIDTGKKTADGKAIYDGYKVEAKNEAPGNFTLTKDVYHMVGSIADVIAIDTVQSACAAMPKDVKMLQPEHLVAGLGESTFGGLVGQLASVRAAGVAAAAKAAEKAAKAAAKNKGKGKGAKAEEAAADEEEPAGESAAEGEEKKLDNFHEKNLIDQACREGGYVTEVTDKEGNVSEKIPRSSTPFKELLRALLSDLTAAIISGALQGLVSANSDIKQVTGRHVLGATVTMVAASGPEQIQIISDAGALAEERYGKLVELQKDVAEVKKANMSDEQKQRQGWANIKRQATIAVKKSEAAAAAAAAAAGTPEAAALKAAAAEAAAEAAKATAAAEVAAAEKAAAEAAAEGAAPAAAAAAPAAAPAAAKPRGAAAVRAAAGKGKGKK